MYFVDNINDKVIEVPDENAFLGSCFGVALIKHEDRISFMIVVEDDGGWFVSHNGGSSYWIPDLIEQMQNAQRWLDENCIKGQWGYSFKEKNES